MENQENQEYLLSFLDIFSNHIGYGTFVIDLLMEILKNNFNILNKLHKISFQKLSDYKNSDNVSFIKMLFLKAQEIENTQQKKLLNLLSLLCFNGFFLNFCCLKSLQIIF